LKKKSEPAGLERIVFPDNDVLRILYGEQDRNLKLIEKLSAVKLGVRGNVISIHGEPLAVAFIHTLLSRLYHITCKGYPLFPADIEYAHRILSEDRTADLERIFLDTVFISAKKRIITPKSIAQKLYIDAIRNGGNGEDLPCHGHGHFGAPGEEGVAYFAGATRRRGG
jgi:phosphate starvation-inducible protein PhoH and related proteins